MANNGKNNAQGDGNSRKFGRVLTHTRSYAIAPGSQERLLRPMTPA
jgi:hypothetical protein